MRKLRDLELQIEAGKPVKMSDEFLSVAKGTVKYQGAYFAVDGKGLSEFPTFGALCRYIGVDGLLSAWELVKPYPSDWATEIKRIQAVLPGAFAPAGTPDDLVVLISAIKTSYPVEEPRLRVVQAN